jgi:hypothetical protein
MMVALAWVLAALACRAAQLPARPYRGGPGALISGTDATSTQ